MPIHRSPVLIAIALALPSRDARGQDPVPAPRPNVAAADTSVAGRAADSAAATRVPRPTVVRGLYVSRWAAISPRMWALIAIARRTEVNALVIDVKDDRGYLLYRSAVPLARRIGADTTQPMPAARIRAVLDTMRAAGIYPIARIVVAKDPLLADARRDWAVRRRSDGQPWLDKDGRPWLDPHQAGVWSYAADLAAEAVQLGFSEVQFDYVRFPDEHRMLTEAAFPLAKGRAREDVIREQLGYLRGRMSALRASMAIDVFGATTTVTSDMGIGQRWEQFADRADVVQPMTYPSHYSRGDYGIDRPNAHPYDVIDRALKDALARNRGVAQAATIVPWYQDFTLGAPRYGVTQLRAQMQAGYDNGIRSWILWNPASKYTTAALRPGIGTEIEEAPRRAVPAADSGAARAPVSPR